MNKCDSDGTGDHSKKAFLLLIILSLLVLVSPIPAISAESAQIIIVPVPINLAFPLLPTQTIIFVNSGSNTGCIVISESGSSGVVGSIRISIQD